MIFYSQFGFSSCSLSQILPLAPELQYTLPILVQLLLVLFPTTGKVAVIKDDININDPFKKIDVLIEEL